MSCGYTTPLAQPGTSPQRRESPLRTRTTGCTSTAGRMHVCANFWRGRLRGGITARDLSLAVAPWGFEDSDHVKMHIWSDRAETHCTHAPRYIDWGVS